MLCGSRRLILFVSSTNYFQIVRQQCFLEVLDIHGWVFSAERVMLAVSLDPVSGSPKSVFPEPCTLEVFTSLGHTGCWALGHTAQCTFEWHGIHIGHSAAVKRCQLLPVQLLLLIWDGISNAGRVIKDAGSEQHFCFHRAWRGIKHGHWLSFAWAPL